MGDKVGREEEKVERMGKHRVARAEDRFKTLSAFF